MGNCGNVENLLPQFLKKVECIFDREKEVFSILQFSKRQLIKNASLKLENLIMQFLKVTAVKVEPTNWQFFKLAFSKRVP